MRVRFSRKEKLAAFTVAILLLLGAGAGRALFFGGTGASPGCSEIPLSNGLKAWYKMDGGTTDSSGNGNDAVNNGASLTTDYRNGANCAYSFNGSSNYMTVPNAYAPTNNILTISAWVKRFQTISNGSIIGNYNSANNVGGYTVSIGASPCSGNQVKVTKFGIVDICIGSFPADTNWHSLIVVWSGSGVVDYVDGVSNGSSANTSNFNASTGPTEIGNLGGSGITYWKGSIDDVRIYNRALTSSEIAQLSGEYSNSKLSAASGEKGLAGWWKFDGNTKDSTPYADNAVSNTGVLAADRRGRANSAYSFNGTNQCMTIPNTSNINIDTYTISVWINTTQTPVSDADFVEKWTGSGSYPYALRLQSNGHPSIRAYDGTNNPSVTATIAVNDGNWHHVVATRTYHGAMQIFVDGVSAGSGTDNTTGTTTGSSAVYVGCRGAPSQYFSGSLDDLRIYNRVLSASEINTLYTSYDSQASLYGATPSGGLGQNLLGWWAFNGNAKDSTPYANNGTVSNATLTTDREGRANSAYSFNGSNASIATTYVQTSVTAFTVSAWVKTTSSAFAQTIWQDRGASGAGVSLTLYINDSNQGFGTTNKLSFAEDTNGEGVGTTSTASVNDGNWHMLTGTWSASSGTLVAASQFHLFIDGQSAASNGYFLRGSKNSPFTGLNGAYIGYHANWPPHYFNGTIDDVRVWNRVLSAAEVSQLYKSYQ